MCTVLVAVFSIEISFCLLKVYIRLQCSCSGDCFPISFLLFCLYESVRSCSAVKTRKETNMSELYYALLGKFSIIKDIGVLMSDCFRTDTFEDGNYLAEYVTWYSNQDCKIPAHAGIRLTNIANNKVYAFHSIMWTSDHQSKYPKPGIFFMKKGLELCLGILETWTDRHGGGEISSSGTCHVSKARLIEWFKENSNSNGTLHFRSCVEFADSFWSKFVGWSRWWRAGMVAVAVVVTGYALRKLYSHIKE